MKLTFLNEYYKDFDYETGEVSGKDVIDTTKTGMSYYDQVIPGHKENDYMRKNKNLVGEIVMMSPKEYYEKCSREIFRGRHSVDDLKRNRKSDGQGEAIEDLKKVITEKKRKFPLPFLNYTEHGQEGLHRMMALGELFGWDEKFPVLVINYADWGEHLKEEQWRHSLEIGRAVDNSLRYSYDDLDEFKEQLQYDINDRFKYYDEFKGMDDIPFELIKKESKYDDEVKKLIVRVNFLIEGELLPCDYEFYADSIKIISDEEREKRDKEFEELVNKELDEYDANDILKELGL